MVEALLSLKDKVALITGAGSGIGRATALTFARQGAHVICTDKSEENVVETLRLIEADGGVGTSSQMDVTSPQQISAVSDSILGNLGRLDILFNNAGEAVQSNFRSTIDDLWSDMIAVNLSGAFYCSKYLLPCLSNSSSGSVINHASVDAILGNAANAAYSAAKGGLIPLTHVMAHDLGPRIRVNCICSGGIYASEKFSSHPGLATRINVTPSGRAGSPDEVAKVALFLACESLSSFVNGSTIVVDGGRTCITQGTYHGY